MVKKMKDEIIQNLRNVYDPEMTTVNVYDLGLIYDIDIQGDEVEIVHTLTSAWCPFSDQIISDIRNAGYVEGINLVNITTTFDPPFTLDSVPAETRALWGW